MYTIVYFFQPLESSIYEFVSVSSLVGRVCVLTLQFHTCLILSEFGVKGFVEECVCFGLGAGQRGNEGGTKNRGCWGCRMVMLNGPTGETLVCYHLCPSWIIFLPLSL